MNERTASAILSVSADIWIRNLEFDTRRTARRLVELGGLFSSGAKQRRFFQLAGALLENRSSEYYTLLRSLCRETDANALKTFGLALGYHTLSRGAIKRRAAWESGVPNVSFASFQYGARADSLRRAVCENAPRGTMAYLVFPDAQADADALADVIRAYRNCAFLVFGELRTPQTNLSLNAMRFLPYRQVLDGIRPKSGGLYGAFAAFDAASLENDLSSARLMSLSEADCRFYVLTAKPGVSQATLARAGAAVSRLRSKLPCPLFPVSLETDVRFVDAPVPQFLPQFAGAL
jgi:hypothetical protein